MFSENLNRVMEEMNLTVSQVSDMTGIGKSSISQYRSGKNIPTPKRVQIIEQALGVDLSDRGAVQEPEEHKTGFHRITVDDVAKALHVNHDTVRKGIKQGVFPWGYAIQTSANRWVYVINKDKFESVEGVKL